jgi:CDP-paratose 2-epimerase
VFTLWVAHHKFGLPLQYTGFGGTGKQVRDLLDPTDLFDLIEKQCQAPPVGDFFNVGGGKRNAISLCELTAICQTVCGRSVTVGNQKESHSVDIPYYVTDFQKASDRFQWEPKRSVLEIVMSIDEWLSQEENVLRPLFCPEKTESCQL